MNNETVEEKAGVESKDSSPIHESRESVESKENEMNEEQIGKGAELLENPPDGSFVHGLQLFMAWVNNLLGKKKSSPPTDKKSDQ